MAGAGAVGFVILLPRLARHTACGRARIGRVMQPTVPIGRHARGFGDAVVDNPALAPAAGDHTLVLEVSVAFGIATIFLPLNLYITIKTGINAAATLGKNICVMIL